MRPARERDLGRALALDLEADALAALGLTGSDPPATVVDLVYGDEPTPLWRWASAGGATVVNGLEVLVRQGARSLELWTGQPAPVAAMRQAAADSASR